MIRVAMPVLKNTYTMVDDRQYCYVNVNGIDDKISLPITANSFNVVMPTDRNAVFKVTLSYVSNTKTYTVTNVQLYYNGNLVNHSYSKNIFYAPVSQTDNLVSGELELPEDNCVISIKLNGNDVKTVKSNQNNGGYVWGKPYKFTPTIQDYCAVFESKVWATRAGEVTTEPAKGNPNNTYFSGIINSMLNITPDTDKIFHGESYIPVEMVWESTEDRPVGWGRTFFDDMFGPVTGNVNKSFSYCIGEPVINNGGSSWEYEAPIITQNGWWYASIKNPNKVPLYAEITNENSSGTILTKSSSYIGAGKTISFTWSTGDELHAYFAETSNGQPVSSSSGITRE